MAAPETVSTRTSVHSPARGSSPRWWPVIAVLLLASGALTWIWLINESWSRQDRNIRTTLTLLATSVLLSGWFLFFSGLRRRVRWQVFGLVSAILLSVPALWRIRGVTGDLLPVLEGRWNRNAGLHLDRDQPLSTASLDIPYDQLTATNDYPQFLGPNRDGTVAGPPLARDWKTSPPAPLWRRMVGAGWSGFAVQGRRAITQEQWAEKEMVVCYDLLTGELLWSHGDETHYHTTIAGEGPRATPTIAGNRVLTLGATGWLNCRDLQTGRCLWSKDILRENQAPLNEWGMSGSPLVVDDLVIVSPGGREGRSLVAYEVSSGRFVWGGGMDAAGYSSPLLTTLAGVRQIVIFNARGVSSHACASGEVLWQYPWPANHPHVSVPLVVAENQLLVSSGYGTGSELLQISSSAGTLSASRIWKSIRLKSKFANLILYQDHVYGMDDGILVCISAADGALRWKEGRYGHGQAILAHDLLLVMAEDGSVVLLEPSPDRHLELARFGALKGKTWNPPALAREFLLIRNDREALCLRLPLASDSMDAAAHRLQLD